MNRTLFDCGIKKEVETRGGQRFDVSAVYPKAVEVSGKPVNCEFCKESFGAKKYLQMHIHFKHPSEEKKLSLVDSSKDKKITESTHEYQRGETSKHSNLEAQSKSVVDQTATEDKRRGQNQRRSYTVEFKIKTLELLDTFTQLKVRKRWEKVAEERGISKSLVVKWNKDREKLKTEVALNKQKKNLGNLRPARQRRKLVGKKVSKNGEKYPLAAERVIVEFKLRRAKGCKVSKLWLKRKMKAKIEICYGKEVADKFKASNNWFQRFKKRHNISFRRRSNKKKNSADDGRETIKKFHQNLRKAVKSRRRRNNTRLDSKHGRWLPKNRYNIDQVPLPFVVEQDKTYEITGSKQVWVSQPSTGLDKRQATLQLCIRADGEQNVKPALVFRGKGNVSSAEKTEYDPRVDVYFQGCAWVDSEVNMQWVSKTLIPGIGKSAEEKVIFADNVSFQQEKEFHKVCREEMNAVVYLLPENHTDKVQPIDAGCGKLLKTKIGEAMESWLEKEENLDLWHDKLSARQRRVLMTKWTGEAWANLSSDKNFFKKLFLKTGCLITADGSDDDLIKPQALEAYTF